MPKQLIQKNIKLSLEFDNYVVNHPQMLKSVPSGTNIIITSASDQKLSEANLAIMNGLRGRFVEAHKNGKNWKIRKVK